MKTGTIIMINYADRPRLGTIIGLTNNIIRVEQYVVEFFDNGERRSYPTYDSRIAIPTPEEIVKWKPNLDL